MKTCSCCGQTKPLPSFNESKLQPDGYCGWCKDCQKRYGFADYDNMGQPMKNKPKKKKAPVQDREDDCNTANGNKGCTRCGILFEASLNYFNLNMSTKDHLSKVCRACAKFHRRKHGQSKQTYAQRHDKAYNAIGKLLTE